METLHLDATTRTPEVDFAFTENSFAIRGESYPEDIREFYDPLLGKLRDHFSTLSGDTITFAIELIYLNSGSTQIFTELFDLLDSAAAAGNTTRIVWVCDEDDENMEELGEEMAEYLNGTSFEIGRPEDA